MTELQIVILFFVITMIAAGVYVNGEVAFINGGPEDENESALDETEDVDK